MTNTTTLEAVLGASTRTDIVWELMTLADRARRIADESQARGYDGPSVFGSAKRLIDALVDIQIDLGLYHPELVEQMTAAIGELSHRPGAVLVDEVLTITDTMLDSLTR